MRKNLKAIIVVCMLIATGMVSAASLTAAANQLKTAYQKLQISRNSNIYQKQFLSAFPTSSKEFNRLFNSRKKDQLYDGNDYIFQLERIAINHPQQTFQLVLNLASELKWQSGAANYLQFVLMKISLNDPLMFHQQMQSLSKKGKSQVVRFMTQGKKGPGVGYTQLVSMLRRLDRNTLADELEEQLYR